MWYIITAMLFGGIFGASFIKNLLSTVISVYKTHGMSFSPDDLSVIVIGGIMGIICLGVAIIGAICLFEQIMLKIRKYH